ncbi:Pimeloyl-ACP methyl ester carboxylesterase [Sphingobium faniae]|nr:Pimeloyl-ACP methyl ester carboxylesterase [Sphingobium faniae]
MRPLLAAAGHEVHTPTLTGLGDRSHLASPEIGLDTHIEDIARFIEWEEMERVILIGHSYAGMVISGVADRMPERIAQLVYLDALAPRDGECAADIVSRGVDFQELRDKMLPPMAGYDFGLTKTEDIAWVRRRIVPQSARTVLQRLHLQNDPAAIPRSFIACTMEVAGPVTGLAERAQQLAHDPDWFHRTLQAGHDCMISHPEETAQALLAVIHRDG